MVHKLLYIFSIFRLRVRLGLFKMKISFKKVKETAQIDCTGESVDYCSGQQRAFRRANAHQWRVQRRNEGKSLSSKNFRYAKVPKALRDVFNFLLLFRRGRQRDSWTRICGKRLPSTTTCSTGWTRSSGRCLNGASRKNRRAPPPPHLAADLGAAAAAVVVPPPRRQVAPESSMQPGGVRPPRWLPPPKWWHHHRHLQQPPDILLLLHLWYDRLWPPSPWTVWLPGAVLWLSSSPAGSAAGLLTSIYSPTVMSVGERKAAEMGISWNIIFISCNFCAVPRYHYFP